MISKLPISVKRTFWLILAVTFPIPILYSIPYIMIHTFYPLALITVILMTVVTLFFYYKATEDSVKEVIKGFKWAFKFIIDTGA